MMEEWCCFLNLVFNAVAVFMYCTVLQKSCAFVKPHDKRSRLFSLQRLKLALKGLKRSKRDAPPNTTRGSCSALDSPICIWRDTELKRGAWDVDGTLSLRQPRPDQSASDLEGEGGWGALARLQPAAHCRDSDSDVAVKRDSQTLRLPVGKQFALDFVGSYTGMQS